MAHEKTLLMVKPDGVKARLTGEIIKRVEMKGLAHSGYKEVQVR